MNIIPSNSVQYGFQLDGLGSHSSRTIMYDELQMLLAACPSSSNITDYQTTIINANALLKNTESTRKKSFRHLRELYGLTPDLLIFRSLRDLWDYSIEARPILAILCALARDPSLRSTAVIILNTPPGYPITSQALTEAAKTRFPFLNTSTLEKIGRNTASSWTQSGHLAGRTGKVRNAAQCHPTSVAYALFLGYLTGVRGDALFETLWSRLLDAPQHTLYNLAIAASRHGWLEYRQSGGITDISFRYLFRDFK